MISGLIWLHPEFQEKVNDNLQIFAADESCYVGIEL